MCLREKNCTLFPHPRNWYPALKDLDRQAAQFCRAARHSEAAQLDPPLFTQFLSFSAKASYVTCFYSQFHFVFHIMCFCFSLLCMPLFLSQGVFPPPSSAHFRVVLQISLSFYILSSFCSFLYHQFNKYKCN